MEPQPLLRIERLGKRYRSGDRDLVVFRDLSLSVQAGEQIAIIGESGAGKSTLLHLVSGLDRPTEGSIFYRDRETSTLPESALSVFRNQEIGYVWQQHHLLPEFSALENVMMPLLIRGSAGALAETEGLARLRDVGLADRAAHRAGELSGGEQQRAAIARALVSKPRLFLADEPTGNLDEKTGGLIFDLLLELRKKYQLTVILVTHNTQFAARCDRILRLESGMLHKA